MFPACSILFSSDSNCSKTSSASASEKKELRMNSNFVFQIEKSLNRRILENVDFEFRAGSGTVPQSFPKCQRSAETVIKSKPGGLLG